MVSLRAAEAAGYYQRFLRDRRRRRSQRRRNKPEGPGVEVSMRTLLHTALLTCSLLPLGSLLSIAQDVYFPTEALSEDSWDDQFKQDWYSHELKKLEEPSLLEESKNRLSESYRFLWLRTFHRPLAIRLDLRLNGSGILTTKVADGEAGFPHTVKHLIENVARPLSREQTRALLAQVRRTDFWSLPSHVDDQAGTDGAEWIIEGVKEGRYHVVHRWSPERGPIRELGLVFVFGMAQMDIPKDQIY
jgi:hypothetical protein